MIIHNEAYCKHTYRISASMLNKNTCNIAYMTTIGEILRQERENMRMSQEDVATKIRRITGEKFSRAALAQIESGSTKNPKPRNMQAACDVLGLDFRSALKGVLVKAGTEISNVSKGPEIRGHVPLISSVPAGDWREAIDNYQPGQGERMVAVTVPVNRHTFAVRVSGDSMEPEFVEGEIVIVEPDLQPEHRDYVIARNGDNEVTLKQLWREGGDWFLKPLNARYPIKPLLDAEIIGVVREKTKMYR